MLAHTIHKSKHRPQTRTPHTRTRARKPGREFSRVVAGTNPTRDCFLRHPTARPLMLLATRGQVRFHFSHSRTGCKQPTGPLSSPTDDRNISACKRLLRKEVIQPHLPVRLPCYDFVPIASPTFTHSLPQGVRPQVSGVADFHDVTGGVYKARERIHRGVADPRLLATPPSWGRVADPNPN